MRYWIMLSENAPTKIKFGGKKSCKNLSARGFKIRQNSKRMSIKRFCQRTDLCPAKQHKYFSITVDFKRCKAAWCTYAINELLSRKEKKLFCSGQSIKGKKGVKIKRLKSCQQYCD